VPRHLILSALAAIAAFQIAPASAQDQNLRVRPGFQLPQAEPPRDVRPDGGRGADLRVIATERVNSREERIVFRIPRGEPPFAELSFRAGDESILLNAAEVTYADGRRQRVDMVDRLLAGQQSRPITLEPGSPPLAEVVVWKRPSWRKAEATLQLLGVPRVMPRPPHPHDDEMADGAPVLIERTVAGNRDERVVFAIGRDKGRFSSIMFRTVEDRVLITRAEIEFANGERQRYDFAQRLDAGQPSRSLDFKDARGIASITLWKRPSFRPGRTTLEVLGVPERRERPRPPEWGGAGPAIPRGWVLFGTETVDFRGDRDVIQVGAEVGRFERIALRVSDNAIFLREITVVYGNGDRDRKVIETEIPASSQTRPIDLQGDRFIKEIELVYRSRPDRRNPAVVEVFGDYARDWLGDGGGHHGHHGGWVMLGAQRASMFQKDQDAIEVGPRYGRLKAIRLSAKRTAVRIFSARVIYGNGDAEELPLSATLKDGETTPAFDLGARGRVVDRIELRYRSKLDFKGQGIVELWAQS